MALELEMRPVISEVPVKPTGCDGSAPSLGAWNFNVYAALVSQILFNHSGGVEAVLLGSPCLGYCAGMHVSNANADTLRVDNG